MVSEFFNSIVLAVIAFFSFQEKPAKLEQAASQQDTPQEIIDQNPVAQTEIVPTDLDRTKMFSEQFCGQDQALLFSGIIESNHLKIDAAIQRGAQLFKASNCWTPFDEAIEQAIRQNHEYILEYLFNKYKAPVSARHITRLQNKIYLLETNLIQDPTSFQELAKKEITLGPVKSIKELQRQALQINANLEDQIEQCETVLRLLKSEFERQERQRNQQTVPSRLPKGAAAAASAGHQSNVQVQQTQGGAAAAKGGP
jgi:hypothetical protein